MTDGVVSTTEVDALASVEGAAEVRAALARHLREGPDHGLFRMNPYAFAAERGLAGAATVDVFLRAAAAGVLLIEWNLVCSCCAKVFRSLRALGEVRAHFNCDLCHYDTTTTLDDYVHITFTVSPRVRKIRFHPPGELTAEDYYEHVMFCGDAIFPDGRTLPDGWRFMFRQFVALAPGERRTFVEAVVPGIVDVLDFCGSTFATWECRADEGDVERALLLRESAIEAPDGPLRAGSVELVVVNAAVRRTFFAVQCISQEALETFTPPAITYTPRLSARELLATQAFRALFRFESVRAGEGLLVRDVTLLFTDLRGSTELYERVGDLNAFALVQQHFAVLEDAARRCRGAIVKTIGDAVMATFLDPADALAAGLDMLAGVAELNARVGRDDILLKMGIHRGAAIAVAQNDKADYFGQTVNVAARIQSVADAGEICMSSGAFEAPGVAELVRGRAVDQDVVALKGLAAGAVVHRIRP